MESCHALFIFRINQGGKVIMNRGWVYTIVVLTSIWSLVGLCGVYHIISGNQVNINWVFTLLSLGFAVNTAVSGAILKAHYSLSQKVDGLNQSFQNHILAHK